MASKLYYGTATPLQVAADLGAALARIRLASNVTQQDVARRAGVGVRTVRRLEAGTGGTLDSFIRVLQALGLENNLEALLPDPGMQPAVRIELGGKERQRARPASERVSKPWTWDEEQTP